jgi:hypothetical protein
VVEYCDHTVHLPDRLPQGKANLKVQYTDEGYEICNSTLGRTITDSKRYINPKMENELQIFKKKIAYRFENKEIPDSYEFPRYQTHLVKIKTPNSSRPISRNAKGYSSRAGSQERKTDY